MPTLDITGPIISDTVYCENELVAKDVTVTLPEVSAITTDVHAMGNATLPIWPLIEDMETVINKIGVDLGLAKLVGPRSVTLEFRWVQVVIDPNLGTRNVGCKAFVRCLPKGIPGIELNVGESVEGEVTTMTTRYQVYVDGEEAWLIDRLAGIIRVNGNDYSSDIQSML